jgi:hypothetical protein
MHQSNVPQNIITKIQRQQNISKKELSDTNFFDHVMKAREKWLCSNRSGHLGKGQCHF